VAAKVAASFGSDHAKKAVMPPPVAALPTPPARKARAPVAAWAGWFAAAAALVLAAGVWRQTHPPQVPLANERARIMALPGVLQASFSATADPASKAATGDVVWSPSEQKGFMRFHGLAANDRSASQYQLWIFDDLQDERYPIDGGVFDVDPSTGDVLVAIHAKIAVAKARAFVITVEKPGGVVVSKRERVVLAAKI
jgi:hypothetical protein